MTVRKLVVLVSIGLVLSLVLLSAATYSVLAQDEMTVELDFATYIGGKQSDDVVDVAIDSYGYIYITGTTGSTDFPTTEDAFDRSHNGGFELDPMDCFVMKLSPDGQEIIYSTFIGGAGDDIARELAVDALGNVYLCGETYSSNFPTLNAYDDSHNSDTDCFVLKLSAEGSELLFSTFVGGSGEEITKDMVTNAQGDCYVTGYTTSDNFPVHTLNNQTLCHTLDGESDGFVFKLNNNGGALDYSMYLGGSYYPDTVHDIVLDSQGNPVIVGTTRSSDFPTVNAHQTELSGASDGYIVKLDAEGRFIFSTYHGGSDADGVDALQLNENDLIYITGTTMSTDYPIVGVNGNILNGTKGVFLSTFDANCTSTLLSGVLRNSYKEGELTGVRKLILVSESEVWLGGTTANEYFPITEDAFDSIHKSREVFVTMINPINSSIDYSTFYGGGGDDSLSGLIMDHTRRLIGVGRAGSSNIPVKDALFDTINDIGTYGDGFVFCLLSNSSEQPTETTITTTTTKNTSATTSITTLDLLIIQIASISIGLVTIVIVAVVIRKSR
ncbi:MAG: SBBP repeat-containing protein [Candidatus Thorarchaeota archaeon]